MKTRTKAPVEPMHGVQKALKQAEAVLREVAETLPFTHDLAVEAGAALKTLKAAAQVIRRQANPAEKGAR